MAILQPAWLDLDRKAGDLEGQIYRALRDRILGGKLAAGQRLPSTRQLAVTLSVARSTVVDAYDRLKSEGYIEATTGSATRVATLSSAPWNTAPPLRKETPPPQLSPAGDGMFRPGTPDVSDFPHAAWGRCLAARARSLRVHDLGYEDACGLPYLKEAVLEHATASRGISAAPEQVLILPSTRSAINLLSRLILRPGDDTGNVAWVEEASYPSARRLMLEAGARLFAIPCDDAGIDVSRAGAPDPSLIYVTPSHQYPTGATMSLPRRLALLERARQSGALIIEDDYDSEFQYGSRPIAALQGIDRAGVVAYLGTFAKILAPGLRIAYAIVPSHLVTQASQAMQHQGLATAIHIQAALADFIREGRLRAYLRQMNARYAERMQAITTTLDRLCGDRLEIAKGHGGLQLATWFKDRATDDIGLVSRLGAQAQGLQPMSQFYLSAPRPGLLFGIARVDVGRLHEAIVDILDRAAS
ncbi:MULTISPECIES: PLP-dependent aminotransferase family protein [unclassified Rhizobium]|uniref:MocR-like pyridoxine biosynthesis transcription factor PdxR n=1 Tax=unclassified Rhizobium TaxID=2613769 RepID=UPI0006F3BD3E|nr:MULTISPECIES: PLP-dependent aminotransferase family protein [unclassified Rhizobium]KQV37540.1 aminotransferase [Rhizobium sp. Root1212]KRD28042.1 aminotransferase [Rhizobium sp. Root268]